MAESTLTERLAETLRAAAAQREAEAAADRLALSQPSDPETIAMDEQSDAQVEQMLLTDEREVRQAQFALLNLVGAWLQAPAWARELCLTSLLTPHRQIIQPRTDQYPEHWCGNVGSSQFRLICSACLIEPIYGMPDETRQKIQLAAASPPVDKISVQELGAEVLINQALERYSVRTAPELGPHGEPTGRTEVDMGSLPGRLADLLREPERETS